MPGGSSKDVSSLEHVSKKLRLSVDPPLQGVAFRPGDTLTGRLACTSDLSSFTSIGKTITSSTPLPLTAGAELQLKSQSSVTVMGKQRWQAAQFATAGMTAMPITTREQHLISLSTQHIWPPAGQAKKDDTSSNSFELGFEMPIPSMQPDCRCMHHPKPLSLPPSFETGGMMMEMHNTNITHVLSLKGKRSGFLKRDERADVDIPIGAVVSGLPDYLEEAASRRGQVGVKYKGSESSGNLRFEAQLHLADAGATFNSPGEIAFTVTWTLVSSDSGAAPPSDGLLDSIDPQVNVSLARIPSTRPIDKPSSGEPFIFGATRVCAATIKAEVEKRGGERALSGVLSIPAGHVSLVTCAASMRYKVQATIVAVSKLDGLLGLSVPILIQ